MIVGKNAAMRTLRWRLGKVVLLVSGLVWALPLFAQELNLSASRPTISNSATIQNAGVLQVEMGYDAYPQRVPGNQQTCDTLITYAALPRLRLDFGWSAYNHLKQDGESIDGVGTISIGGKVEVHKEQDHHLAPGFALQYEAQLPTASREALQGYGQQAILLLDHQYGRDGVFDVIVNGSIVQANCQASTGCSYGGQHSFAISYLVAKDTHLYAELFGQNTSQANTPPGTYVFSGFDHQFSDSFGIDGGLRFGVSDHSASIGTTVGLVFGRRLRHGRPPG